MKNFVKFLIYFQAFLWSGVLFSSPCEQVFSKATQSKQIVEKGNQIIKNMRSTRLFSGRFVQTKLMELAMQDEAFKMKLLHFTFVLPMLKTDKEVLAHWNEYFKADEKDGRFSQAFSWLNQLNRALPPFLLAKLIRKQIEQVALIFIAGKDLNQALKTIESSRKKNLSFSIDILGEAVLSEKEALAFQTTYLKTLKVLHQRSQNWKNRLQIDNDSTGRIPSVNLSLKLSSLVPDINEKSETRTVQLLKDKLRPIFRKAVETFSAITLDMEQYHHKHIYQRVFKEILMEDEFKKYPHFGLVLQAYLKDSSKDAQQLIQFAKRRGVPFEVRLVKGAYWDQEIITARQKNWEVPVFINKRETDENYELITKKLFSKGYPHLRVALGSHNVRSLAAGLTFAEQFHVPKNDFEIQMLYGMGDPIKEALIKEGYRVREYNPVGKLIPGMAYLVRRLLENTANESFIRALFTTAKSAKTVLENPLENVSPQAFSVDTKGFINAAPIDFSLHHNWKKMDQALSDVKKKLGKTHALFIDGSFVKTDRTLESVDPANRKSLGDFFIAGEKEGKKAVASSLRAFQSWKQTSVKQRVQLLKKLGQLIIKKRFELMALEVFEVGKTWSEADGDVMEALDFIRYYSQEMEKLSEVKETSSHIPGERNTVEYRPRGVVAVIAPWNFPLAILTGMTVAPLVAGNTVIVKPAEQSMLVASELMYMMKEVGFPKGVVNFVPGYGEEIGSYLVNHPDVSVVSFTGSRDVGLNIVKQTSIHHKGMREVKRAVVEMGGKNALIVDSSADLDQAIQGAIESAFGFQGQKCSACSRLILLEDVYEEFLSRFTEATSRLLTVTSKNPEADLGPVIDKEAFQKIQRVIRRETRRGKLAYQGSVSNFPNKGFFIPPTVFKDVNPRSFLGQKELFGPVVSVIKAKNLDEAIAIANNVPYGLTGGIYSRTPSHIKRVQEQMEVGNFYVNKPITGSIVSRQPFGGVKLSGVGNKSGGSDYLRNFLNPITISDGKVIKVFKH